MPQVRESDKKIASHAGRQGKLDDAAKLNSYIPQTQKTVTTRRRIQIIGERIKDA